MNRRLQHPTADDVSDDATYERGQELLDAWLIAILARGQSAIERVQQLAYDSGAECYADLEQAMRAECESDALEQILEEMDWAVDGHVQSFMDAREFA